MCHTVRYSLEKLSSAETSVHFAVRKALCRALVWTLFATFVKPNKASSHTTLRISAVLSHI